MNDLTIHFVETEALNEKILYNLLNLIFFFPDSFLQHHFWYIFYVFAYLYILCNFKFHPNGWKFEMHRFLT